MGLIPPLIAELGASTTEFSAKMAEAREEVKETEDSSNSSMSSLSSVGKGALLGLGAVAIGVGGASLELAEKFQSATASVAGNAGITVAAANKIGDAFLSTGFHSTFSAQEMMSAYSGVAGQLGEINGKALTSAQALDVMRASSDLAEASGTSLATATSDVTNTLQAFHLNVAGATDATTDLFNAGRLTGLGMDGVASQLDKLGAKLGAAAPPLDEMSAVLVDMTNNGVTGRSAITDLDTGITNLVQPTTAGAKVLASLGLNSAVAAAQSGDLQGAIDLMSAKFNAMTPAAAQAAAATIFGTTAWKGMLPVLEAGAAGFDKAQAAVSKSGSVETAAAAQASTMHGELKTLESGAEDLGVKLGQILIPIVTKLIGVIGQATSFLLAHKEILIVVGGIIGGYLVGAIAVYIAGLVKAGAESVVNFAKMVGGWFGIGPAAEGAAAEVGAAGDAIIGTEEAIGTTAEAVGPEVDAGLGPIGLILGAVGLAATLLMTHWKTVFGVIKDVASAVVGWLRPAFAPIEQVFHDIGQWVSDAYSFIKAHLDLIVALVAPFLLPFIALVQNWGTVWGAIQATLSAAWDVMRPIIDTIGEVLKVLAEIVVGILVVAFVAAWDVVKAVVTAAWSVLSPVFSVISSVLGAVIPPVVHALGDVFSFIWEGIVGDVSKAWAILSAVFGAIGTVLGAVIPPVLNALKAAWSGVWSAIQSVVQAVWAVLKPIFDAIGSVLSTITGGISKVTGALASIGGGAIGSAAKLLGFASGGIVPGSTGAAQLAVVHGGEMVLPADALSNTQPGLPLPSLVAGGGGGAGATNLALNLSLQLDSRTLWQQMRNVALQDQAFGRWPGTGLKT